MKERTFISVFITLFFTVMIALAFIAPGTADSGDSIGHFLHAKYAFAYSWNFFDTWAKPLYVLLAAPFAQLGFKGVKFFNVIVATLSLISCYLTAKRLQLSNSWLVSVFLALAPFNILITLSGLTEPLFACVLMSGLCLLFYERLVAGLIVFSFLPFVRSEGLFMLFPIAIYLLVIKKPWYILLLSVGQIGYAIAGYFRYKNLLWFYIWNPYHFKSQYGQGQLNTYFVNMPATIGYPLSLLLGVGLIVTVYYFIKRIYLGSAWDIPFTRLLLIYVLFILFFSFHTIAWKFGLFSSFGMMRYMVSVIPLMAIICLVGFNSIVQLFDTKYNKHWVLNGIALVVIIVPTFLPIPYSGNYYHWNKDFGLRPDQVVEQKLANYTKLKYPDYKDRIICYHASYYAVALDLNPFDSQKRNWGWDIWDKEKFKSRSLYMWDDWYSVEEGLLTLQQLMTDTTLVKDTSFSKQGSDGTVRTAILFLKK